ncbi:hypothetical protein EVAR_62685_1 [Eumeta japonica]|uniref:Uncharacterized protein n=1 Tax=Eumeta variegata TaxID=151549 RepID=A0A4C1ZZZ2_EUMVA|nr:hypothetical protein EVAR_62685_1 [Eumeta japonica]
MKTTRGAERTRTKERDSSLGRHAGPAVPRPGPSSRDPPWTIRAFDRNQIRRGEGNRPCAGCGSRLGGARLLSRRNAQPVPAELVNVPRHGTGSNTKPLEFIIGRTP